MVNPTAEECFLTELKLVQRYDQRAVEKDAAEAAAGLQVAVGPANQKGKEKGKQTKIGAERAKTESRQIHEQRPLLHARQGIFRAKLILPGAFDLELRAQSAERQGIFVPVYLRESTTRHEMKKAFSTFQPSFSIR